MKAPLIVVILLFACTLQAGVSITTPFNLPESTWGAQYNTTITASGGTTPYVWQIVDGFGTVPNGLSINPASGALAGTLTGNSSGGFTFKVMVTDQAGTSDSLSFLLIINSRVTIGYNNYLAWTVGSKYTSPVNVGGGTRPIHSLGVTAGNLPNGLTFDGSNVVGTPTVAGVFNFTFTATDAVGVSGSNSFTITINPPPAIATPSLPNGVVGTAYSASLASTGGTAPLQWYANTALPAGLGIASNGLLSGTPTTAGNYTFILVVGDPTQASGTQSFSIVVSNPSNLSITTPSPLPAARVGTAYSRTFAALNGVSPYTWLMVGGTMPPGLTIGHEDGVLRGTPQVYGSYSIDIQVTDANGATAVKSFAIDVAPAQVKITTTAIPSGVVGVPYSFPLQVTGGVPPYVWYRSGGDTLPFAIALDRDTGLISGTTFLPNTYHCGIGVIDSKLARSEVTFTLTIDSTLTITTPSGLPAGIVGRSYSYGLTGQGGAAGYRWSVDSGFPVGGMSLDPVDGRISGIPSAPGTYNFTVRLHDNAGTDALKGFSLTVGPVVEMAPGSVDLSTQPMTFTFNDPHGAANLGVLNILVNNYLDGRHACYLAYVPQSNLLLLVNDAGDAGGPFAGQMNLDGSLVSIQNSQCAVVAPGSSKSLDGNTLTLKLNISFKPSFAGNKLVYLAARDVAENSSGWQALAAAPLPFAPATVMSVSDSPRRSTSTPHRYTFTVNDTKGVADVGIVNVLINSFIDGRHGCYLAYVASQKLLLLVNDAGDAGGPFAGSVTLGAPGIIANSQCTVGLVSVEADGSDLLKLTLDISYSASFTGNRVLYMAARDVLGGNNTEWQPVGTWSAQ